MNEMTKPASGNEKDVPEATSERLTPIQDWENRDVKGEALAAKELYDDHVAKVMKLRNRQEAYEASLPKEPLEALSEIRRTLADIDDLSSSEYAPRAALEIIHQLVTHGALDDSDQMREAVYWLVGQGLDGIGVIEGTTRRARNIARQFGPMHRPYQA